MSARKRSTAAAQPDDAVAEPTVAEPTVAEPTVAEPTVAEPTVAEAGAAEQAPAEAAVGSEATGASSTLGEAGTAAVARPAAPGSTNDSRTADFTAGPGGVMTDEAGVVTGELTLRTELTAGEVTLRVQYKDADEWYVVTGGRASLKDPADLDAVHGLVIALLNRPEG